MDKNIFQYKTYNAYLKARLEGPGAPRGVKTQIAQGISVQGAYISLILKEKAHLSLEQAEAVNSFFNHDSQEAHFFLLMVLKDRAGTKSLKQHFQKQIDDIIKLRLQVKERLSLQNPISEKDRAWYYASWIPAALHMAVTIPKLSDPKTLAQILEIPSEKVVKFLERLEGMKLIQKKGLHYVPGVSQIHLGQDSDQLIKHHTNWRLQAIQSLPTEKPTDLHYSAVVTLSEEDVEKIKNILLDSVKSCIDKIKVSKEEALFGFSVDFFNLIKK